MRRVAIALFLLLTACTSTRVPDGAVWIAHMQRDLMPFWTTPAAIGDPVGNFPTYRCHDGSRYDANAPCPELANAGSWITDNLGREYVRMKSRQTYFYGAAFHLTGDPRMLELAKAGADWIRAHPPQEYERTAQDLAYEQVGLAMLYNLTRDRALLADILRIKSAIFALKDDGELVSLLDQINAYMLLLTPILPEPQRTEWSRDLEHLADRMIREYFVAELGMFRGTQYEQKLLGSRHTDFGHTIKALWMIERIGRVTGRKDLVSFAQMHAPSVLDRAWIAKTGCWATGIHENGELDRALVWWSFAELDQMTATLAMTGAAREDRLPDAYRCWFANFVDPEHHEVWGFVNPDDPSQHGAKAHLWKNGYHSAEHALVGYLAAQHFHRKPAVLWFAFDDAHEPLRPYVFEGRVAKKEKLANGTLRVTFRL